MHTGVGMHAKERLNLFEVAELDDFCSPLESQLSTGVCCQEHFPESLVSG